MSLSELHLAPQAVKSLNEHCRWVCHNDGLEQAGIATRDHRPRQPDRKPDPTQRHRTRDRSTRPRADLG